MSESDQQKVRETDVYLHPIQLQFVAVRELFVRTYRHLSPDFTVPDEDIQMESIFTGYNKETKSLQINTRVRIGDDRQLSREEESKLAKEEKWMLRMMVHLVGEYSVDEEHFPMEKLDEWANKGGALTLFPYVREHVYSLTARCGIRPVILPIMQMPTVKIALPVSTPEPATAGISN